MKCIGGEEKYRCNKMVIPIICFMILIGYILQVYVRNKMVAQMPDIVFTFCGGSSVEEYDIWYIDKNGNVYYTKDKKYDELGLECYQELRNDPACKIVKTIDKQIVQKKYLVLEKILHGRENINIRKIEKYNLDQELGTYSWIGGCKDSKGKVTTICLQTTGDLRYELKDARAQELADWLTECLELDDFYRNVDYGGYSSSRTHEYE